MKFFKFILFFSVLSIFSQNRKIDSLELILKNYVKRDTVYVNLLNKVASEFYPNDNNRVQLFATKAKNISDSLNYIMGKAESYYLLGKVETTELNLDFAEKKVDSAFAIFKKEENFLGKAKCLNQKGVIYYYKNENEKALDYFYRAISVNKWLDDHTILANSYNNIGLIYYNKNELDKALTFYKRALKIHRRFNNLKFITTTLNNIGIIYNDKENFTEALKIYSECLEIAKKENNNYLIGFTNHNLGVLYETMKDYKNALRLYELALDINDNNGVCFAYNGLGSVYIKLGKYNTALKYINRSKKIAEKHNLLRHKLNINRMLAIIWEEKKEYKKSLGFYKKYKIDYDSINSLEVNNRLTDLETKYNFKKNELLAKEKEIKLNEKIDQTNIKLNETKRQILYGLILVLFLFVVLGFVVYNARIKRLSSDYQKVVLKQKLLRSQMKPHFIFNSLSVLQGIVLHKEYDKASTYISKFSRLLREILETSKEEIINLESEIRIIENYIFLQYISHNSNCTYKITIDKKIDVENFYIPPMIVQPIVENSFEHGFIEINKSYELSIDFELVNGKLVCTITDNGEGLNDSNNKNYFEKKKSVSSTIIKERLELFSKKYGEKYSFKVIDRTLTGNKGTEVILLLPYKIGYND